MGGGAKSFDVSRISNSINNPEIGSSVVEPITVLVIYLPQITRIEVQQNSM
jgi:hypothetical protein